MTILRTLTFECSRPPGLKDFTHELDRKLAQEEVAAEDVVSVVLWRSSFQCMTDIWAVFYRKQVEA